MDEEVRPLSPYSASMKEAMMLAFHQDKTRYSLLEKPLVSVKTADSTTITAEQRSCSKPVVGKMEMPPHPVAVPPPSSTCHVCSAEGATLHYGGVVCGSCKIFFARAVQRKLYYVCEKSGCCRMISGKRSKCRSCRFQQCLKARMCPEEVGKLRDLKGPERLIVRAEENSVIPYFDFDDIRRSRFENHMETPFIDRFGLTEGVKYIARMFVNLERSCDNDTYASGVTEQNFCSVDVSLKKAIQNPLMVSERTPVSWQGLKPLNDPESSAKPSYCRLVLHYLEWLAAVEELATLDEKRRLKLTTKHMIATILLTISFNTFKYGSVHLLLCNGFFFPQKRQQTTDGYHTKIEVIVNELERNVVNRLRELRVCEEEYVLLKLVLLFSHRESLGEKYTETTRRLHGKYDQVLLHYVKHSQGDCSVEELIDRISSLFELLTSLNSISEMAELCLVHIVALDIAGMRGKLTFDLHLRQHQ